MLAPGHSARHPGWFVAALTAACLTAGVLTSPARAQETTTTEAAPSTSTTSTSSTPPPQPTGSTAPPTSPAPSATGEATTTTAAATPEDPTAGEEAPPESVPDVDVTIPPASDAGPPPALVRIDADEITAAVAAASEAVRSARERLDELTARLAELERTLVRVDVAHADAVSSALSARESFDRRVVDAYVRGNPSGMETLTSVADVLELQIAQTLLSGVAEADLAAAAEYVAHRETLEAGLSRFVDAVADTRAGLRSARHEMRSALAQQQLASYRYAIFAAGSDMIIDGFVFPVGEPYSFIDSWGFPRMIGTEYAHGHQGVDIMAPFGTPLYACERGVITRMGTDTLGGIKLWLRGESGTSYYYAHLQRYEDGIAAGTVVDAGQVIGRVGDTGNARGGAPHLHFQMHPGGGAAVNPYPLLRSVADLGT